MYLMRIGASGAEEPVARLDDDTSVDLSHVVADLDEAFSGSEGLDRIRPLVAERAAARPGDVMELGVDGLGSQRQHVVAPR